MSQTNTISLDDCWLWAGWVSPKGYGQVKYRYKGKLINCQAHRVMYEALIGKIPKGLVIDHLCRVRHCLNIEHMEVVTNQENVRRGLAPSANNARKTHCIRGHEFTDKNTLTQKVGDRIHRHCAKCKKDGRR